MEMLLLLHVKLVMFIAQLVQDLPINNAYLVMLITF